MNSIGFDIGATELRISVPGIGIIHEIPSKVAVDRDTLEMLRFGEYAEKWVAKKESKARLVIPFANGIVPELDLAARILSYYRKEIFPDGPVRALLSIPCNLDKAEEEQIVCAVMHAGFADCRLVYSPIAALVGEGHSLEKPYLAVDVGYHTTDIVHLWESEIVSPVSIPTGGYAFTEAICDYILKKHHLHVKIKSAENIKKQIGALWMERECMYLDVLGVSDTGKAAQTRLSTDEMFVALEDPCAKLLSAIHTAISKIPFDAVKETFERGILLGGGGSLLLGMDKMISGITGVKCTYMQKPTRAVSLGLAEILKRLPDDLPPTGYNISGIAVKNCSYLD